MIYFLPLLPHASLTRSSPLTPTYSMKDLGVVNKFLGMNIHQGSKAITHSLEDYIIPAASSANIPMHRPVYAPLSSVDPLFNHKKSPLLTDVRPYQSIIGQLIFIANAGRPDVAYAVSILSRFLKNLVKYTFMLLTECYNICTPRDLGALSIVMEHR